VENFYISGQESLSLIFEATDIIVTHKALDRLTMRVRDVESSYIGDVVQRCKINYPNPKCARNRVFAAVRRTVERVMLVTVHVRLSRCHCVRCSVPPCQRLDFNLPGRGSIAYAQYGQALRGDCSALPDVDRPQRNLSSAQIPRPECSWV
jgi:hypothetical protein